MDLPDLYHKVAVLPKIDFAEALEKFTANKRWKENASVIDIGCGDGSTTMEVLLKYIPQSYKKLVAFDVSAKMVEYAKRRYAERRVEFMMHDITETFPEHMHNAFDHAFSSFVFQRLQNQKSAFLNTYKLLREGGNCLHLIIGQYPLYDVLRALSRQEKWADDLEAVETFISPYHDSQDRIKDVCRVMESVGFKNIEVNILEKTNTFKDENTFKDLIKSIQPFKALNKRWDEFMADYFELSPLPYALKVDYKLIVAYGTK